MKTKAKQRNSKKGIFSHKKIFLLVNLSIYSFQLECLVALGKIFDRNTEGNTSKI